MKTTYSVEKVQSVYEYLKDCKRRGYPRAYRVLVDGVEIVARTKELEHFHDFLHYSGEQAKELTIAVYYLHLVDNVYTFEYREGDAKQIPSLMQRISATLDKLYKKCAQLRAEVKRTLRAKKYERVRELKVLDMGESILICVPKAELKKHMDAFEAVTLSQYPHMRHALRLARKVLFS